MTQTAVSGLTASSGTLNAWEASVNGLRWFRIRCSVNVSANSKAGWTVQRSWNASDPSPVAQVTATQPISGSVTASPVSASAYSAVTTAGTNAVVVRNAAASLFEVTVSNVTATAAYVKLYNKTSAPTVGTDVPVLTIPAPANSLQVVNLGALGKRFTSGISIAVTAGIAATDTANAVAGAQIHASYV